MKRTKWISYVILLFLCISPETVFAVSDLEAKENIEELNEQQKILPSVVQKKITWTGGYIQIPVDVGGYSADELSLCLSMEDGDQYFNIIGELDGNTAKFPIFQTFDGYGSYQYRIFTKAGTYDGQLTFYVSENNYLKELCTETVTVVVPKDSTMWKLSRQTVKFDGSRDIVFSFENGTNGCALHSVSRVGLFVDKSVGNLFLPQGFQCDMKSGKLTISRDVVKKALLDFAKKQEAGVHSLPNKIYVNAFAVTEGGEELRFNIIDSDDFPGSKDVAWSLDLTGFKSAQISQQKVGQKIKNKYDGTLEKSVGSKITQKVTGANTQITFRSLNTKVAKVGKTNGVITCVGVGKAVIISEAAESSKYKKASSQVTIRVIPKTAGIKYVKSSKKGQVTIQSDMAAKGNDGYQIQYKHNGKTATVKVPGKKSVIHTFKKLRSGNSFKVRIRAYKKAGDQIYYGNYSKWKSIKKVK